MGINTTENCEQIGNKYGGNGMEKLMSVGIKRDSKEDIKKHILKEIRGAQR